MNTKKLKAVIYATAEAIYLTAGVAALAIITIYIVDGFLGM